MLDSSSSRRSEEAFIEEAEVGAEAEAEANTWSTIDTASPAAPRKVKLIDVGSCYNPFESCGSAEWLDVLALDLFPTAGTLRTE